MSSFCKCKSYSYFFSKNICLYAIVNSQSFNDKLTNNIISFEQLGPGLANQLCCIQTTHFGPPLNYLVSETIASLGGSVGCASDWRSGGVGFDPLQGRQHSSAEIDHEIFSTVILSLLLIQEGQLSVSGERMCTI